VTSTGKFEGDVWRKGDERYEVVRQAAVWQLRTPERYPCTRSGGRRVNRLGYGRCQGPAASGEGVGWPACQAVAAWIR
jgi:hypothetical protein